MHTGPALMRVKWGSFSFPCVEKEKIPASTMMADQFEPRFDVFHQNGNENIFPLPRYAWKELLMRWEAGTIEKGSFFFIREKNSRKKASRTLRESGRKTKYNAKVIFGALKFFLWFSTVASRGGLSSFCSYRFFCATRGHPIAPMFSFVNSWF